MLIDGAKFMDNFNYEFDHNATESSDTDSEEYQYYMGTSSVSPTITQKAGVDSPLPNPKT